MHVYVCEYLSWVSQLVFASSAMYGWYAESRNGREKLEGLPVEEVCG